MQSNRLRFTALILLGLILAACGREVDVSDQDVSFLPQAAGTQELVRTTICHFTGLQSMPYIAVSVSNDAVTKHQGHRGDIVPAPMEGCPAVADIALFQMPAATSAATVQAVTPAATEPGQPPTATATMVPAQPTDVCGPDGFNVSYMLDSIDNLVRFREMLRAAGWLEALKDTDITLLAPSDDAFAVLDAGLLAEIMQDPEALNALLLYHVVPGRWDATLLGTTTGVETLSGEWLEIVVPADGELVFNQQAEILTPNLEVCNGTIHIIDHVLMPPIFINSDDDDQPHIAPTATRVPSATPQPTPTTRPTNAPPGGGGGGNDQPPPIAPPNPTPRPTSTPQPTATDEPPTATDSPTDVPTDIPTDPPTEAPTDIPTDVPTDVPTESPTDPPTEPPTDIPTDPPSDDGGGTGGGTP